MSSIHFFFRRGLSAAALACLSLAAVPASAGIHRCVGAGGHVTYTDQGCPAAANASHLPDDLQGQPDPLAPTGPAPGTTPVSYQATTAAADTSVRAAGTKR